MSVSSGGLPGSPFVRPNETWRIQTAFPASAIYGYMSDIATIEAKFRDLSVRLDEATLRIWAATEARSLGRGGVSLVAKATGLSRKMIYAGLAELIDENAYEKGIKVSDEELASLTIERDVSHGEWNYLLIPRNADG
jgi:hypothetical protein